MRSDVKMTAAIDRPIGAGFGGTMARPGGYMARRAVGWLSWAVVLLALLGYGLYLALGLSSPMVSGLAAFSLDDAVWVLGQVAYAIVGALVASRRPELPIGWLFCIAGLIGLAGGIAARAAVHALADTSGSTAGGTAAWLSAALWYPNVPCWCWAPCCACPVGRRRVAGGRWPGCWERVERWPELRWGCCGRPEGLNYSRESPVREALVPRLAPPS